MFLYYDCGARCSEHLFIARFPEDPSCYCQYSVTNRLIVSRPSPYEIISASVKKKGERDERRLSYVGLLGVRIKLFTARHW